MKTRQTLPLLAFTALLAFALPHSSVAQATYYNMTTGDYSQDFADITNTAVWASPTTGSWQGLATNATGTIPSATRITASSIAFQTNSSSGGVQRGVGNMQLLSTGSTDNSSSTGVDLLLDFSGRNAGSLSFQAAQVANASGNRAGTLRAYYTIDGAAWAEIVGGGLPYTATNNVASSNAVSIALPSAINNSSTVRVRFYYNNGGTNASASISGSRPKISIDNVLVTSTPAVAGAPVITSGTTSSVVAYVATANIYQITASNSPDSYAATGLPAGLSIDTVTGIISGTATTPGVYSVAITATNSQGTGGATLTLTVSKNPGAPTISSALTATGLLGDPTFSYAILANNSPTSYSAGTLPAGLTLDTATGIITGTPSAGGVFNVSITAANAVGSDTQTLAITINSPPVITSSTSGSLYDTNNFLYTITASFAPTSFGASNLPAGWGVTSTATNGVVSNGVTPLVVGTNQFEVFASNAYGTGSATYTLKVFDQAMQDAVPLNVVVNKYVNGTPDKVQLLVIGDGSPGSTVDMRGMIIKDFSTSMANDSGGKFIFADNALWSAVPAGTFVTLSAGTTQAEDIDATDFYIAVNLGNATYFSDAGGSFDIATTDMLLLKSAGSGASGVAGGIHALAGGTAGAQFTSYTGAKLRTTGTSGTDLGVIALNSTSQLSDYGAAGQTEATDAQGGQTAASLNFASWNSPGNENYVKLLRGIVDGTGTAAIANATTGSDFIGQNIFGRNLSNQTVVISYVPAGAQTAVTALSVTVPSQMGTPTAPDVSVSGVGTGSSTVAVTNQVVTISGLNALNPAPVEISISGLSTPDTATSVTNSGRYTFSMQSQGSGGSLAPLSASPAAVVLIPIANARNADPTTFVPTLLGQTVAVEGVANVGKLGTGGINSSLQDTTHGIGIYSTNLSNLPERGSRYVVSGGVTQVSGLVRINITNYGAFYDFGPTNNPAPVTVTVPQFNASTGATNGINLQSRVVQLDNLYYVSGTWAVSNNVVLRDAASNNVTVRIQAGSAAVSAPSYPVTLIGIAGQFDSASPYDTGFQIQPRDQADAPVLPPVITSATNATATNGIAFSYQITTDNNPPATSFGATSLPAGLSVNTSTGLISGTPTATGTFNVPISATNAGGTDTETLVLTVVASGQTFANWAQGAPLNSANLLLYAIGGASSPTATNGVASTTALTSSNLSITAVVRTNDSALSTFGYAVTNLVTGPWSSNGVTMTPAASQVGVPEGCQMQIFSTPRATDAAKFLRLQSTLTNQ